MEDPVILVATGEEVGLNFAGMTSLYAALR